MHTVERDDWLLVCLVEKSAMNPINRWMANQVRAHITGAGGAAVILGGFLHWTNFGPGVLGITVTLTIMWMMVCIVWCEIVKPVDPGM